MKWLKSSLNKKNKLRCFINSKFLFSKNKNKNKKILNNFKKMKNLNKFFLLTLIFTTITFSSCEKISEFSNPFSTLSEADKNISTEFLKDKIYK
jgi:hypothetical protein